MKENYLITISRQGIGSFLFGCHRFKALILLFFFGIILGEGSALAVAKDAGPPVTGQAVQDVTISGRVTDEDGEPIPGATVSIPGTTTGTATDLDGKYSMTVPEGATLVYSFIGIDSHPARVGLHSIVDIL